MLSDLLSCLTASVALGRKGLAGTMSDNEVIFQPIDQMLGVVQYRGSEFRSFLTPAHLVLPDCPFEIALQIGEVVVAVQSLQRIEVSVFSA